MHDKVSKVPQVTLGFWLIKILATTLGETGGDAVTMTLNLGYLVGTIIFGTVVIIAVALQIFAKRFNPALYWTVIVATTTVGTTLADFVDRSVGWAGLPGRFTHLAQSDVGLARHLVLELRLGCGRARVYAKERALLLDHHSLLSDPRYRAR
jgi:uncharacterized membrane-anchored protein